jgi:hypothetical protein
MTRTPEEQQKLSEELQRINDRDAAALKKQLDAQREEQMKNINLAIDLNAEAVVRAERRIAKERDDAALQNAGHMTDGEWEAYRKRKFGF